MVVSVPPLNPPARGNTACGGARETRPGSRGDNTDLQVRLLQETKAHVVFLLLHGGALPEPTQGSVWLSRCTASTRGTGTSR